ncbi:uncharacterized protein SPAPADRAFT_59722 [Spathaspora passalidarum NRRL Y-27907]|uniref:Domain of unknown function at the cortex 1 domain-containing protein n=1 Tax=Spathaspora passalidarum (strain NRRL Y-27907 / 11-Y1) TaxID=619300 RepID=G3AHY3_SPAPN|nr:uncharacterized protein SPAPADRAFT_59722 [Spathaspora passalidarum NRRL Y-27907]EGW34297.1 hypothetical protein SPAPADRAFT_59722 [Spathaspora passalidarum NRRL Y-27907]
MAIVHRLYITASNNYSENFQIVAVNTTIPLEIDSEIGVFKVVVNIKDFDGSKPHLSNSCYNIDDDTFLDGEPLNFKRNEHDNIIPNVRMQIEFTPKKDINGAQLIFGNDFTYPVKKYIPTMLLTTGLKLYNLFVSNSVQGNLYSNKPYLYGLALNNFTYMGIDNFMQIPKIINSKTVPMDCEENVSSQLHTLTHSTSQGRIKYFNQREDCEEFVFKQGVAYNLQFDTNYVKMSNSNYAICIPKFDVNVNRYVNETLNNFNYVIKEGGHTNVDEGTAGLVINFALRAEEEHLDS